MPVILFLVVLLTGIVAGLLGTTRRIGFWIPFLASWFITPIGAALLAILSGPKVRRPKKHPAKRR